MKTIPIRHCCKDTQQYDYYNYSCFWTEEIVWDDIIPATQITHHSEPQSVLAKTIVFQYNYKLHTATIPRCTMHAMEMYELEKNNSKGSDEFVALSYLIGNRHDKIVFSDAWAYNKHEHYYDVNAQAEIFEYIDCGRFIRHEFSELVDVDFNSYCSEMIEYGKMEILYKNAYQFLPYIKMHKTKYRKIRHIDDFMREYGNTQNITNWFRFINDNKIGIAANKIIQITNHKSR